MVYIVQAVLDERGAGSFRAETKTKRDAIEKARDLRQQGLKVEIIGPDGKRVDESEVE